MPLILVKISKDQKGIYDLNELVSLDVSVEPLRSSPHIGQCYRCQRYDHVQSRCTAIRKCVSCGGEHPSGDCPRPKSKPPTCANCGDTHPAYYRGCIRCPKPRAAPPRAARTPKKTTTTAFSNLQPCKTFFQAVAPPTWTATQAEIKVSQTPKLKTNLSPGQGHGLESQWLEREER